MKSLKIATITLIASSLTLAACSSEPEPVVEPEGVPGLSVSNARMLLAPVSGNPAAVYFDVNYEGDRGLSISRAYVEGAETATLHAYGEYAGKMQMAEAMPIAMQKGDEIIFEPGGLHVMAFEVSPDLKPGDTTEVTITVSGGDKHSFDAEVRAAGDER
ncbi:MAG: copper chaperone PCu(A)C [Erythrobacter sp.]